MSTESKTYRLIEMSESMQESINNILQIVDEQRELVKIVTASDAAKKFEKFIEGINEQIDNFNAQVRTLTTKKQSLDKVISACADNDETEKYVTLLLSALGVFENDVPAN